MKQIRYQKCKQQIKIKIKTEILVTYPALQYVHYACAYIIPEWSIW